jgi:hypothetical protein
MKERIPTLTLIALVVGLAGAVVFVESRRRNELAELNESRQEIAALKEQLSRKSIAPASTPSTSVAKTDTTASSGTSDSDQDAEKKKEDEQNPLAAMLKGLGEAMNSKEARDAFKEMAKGGVMGQYGDLFAMLGLDETKKAALTELLATGEQDQQAAGMKFMAGKMSHDEMATLVADMQKKQETMNGQIKDILGDDAKYGQYQKFVDSKPEREQLAMIRSSLKDTANPLSEDQEQKVMDVLYTERKNYAWEVDFSNDREWSMDKMNPTAMDRFVEQQEQFDQHVSQRLDTVLVPEQKAGFDSANAQRRTMTKFAVGMFKSLVSE